MKPYPYTPEQEAWLRDLETTTEPQTTGWLHVVRRSPTFPDPGYCCLGRACVVLGEKGKIHTLVESFNGYKTTLPNNLVEKLHLRDNDGSLASDFYDDDGENFVSLIDMNDADWTFKEIAAYIRENPWNVFKDPEASE